MRILIDNSKRAEWPKRCRCEFCDSILEVNNEDVTYHESRAGYQFIPTHTINCPCCDKESRYKPEFFDIP